MSAARAPSGTAARPAARRCRPGDASGQATVELALLFPVVCGLLVLAIQVGAVLRSQVLLVHLTRQVAREAAASSGEGEIDVGGAARAAGLDPARLELEVAPADGDGLVTVRAAYRQPLAVPVIGIVHRDVTLAARLSVRAEEAEDAGQS